MSKITGADSLNLMEAYYSIYSENVLNEEQIWEEVELWVNDIIEEGCDLSEYTWDELYECYLSIINGQELSESAVTLLRSAPAAASKIVRFVRGAKPTRVPTRPGHIPGTPGRPPARPRVTPNPTPRTPPHRPAPAPAPAQPTPAPAPSKPSPAPAPSKPSPAPAPAKPSPAPAPAKPSPAPAPAKPSPTPAPTKPTPAKPPGGPTRPIPSPAPIKPPGRPTGPGPTPQTEPMRAPIVPRRNTRVATGTPSRPPASKASGSDKGGKSPFIPPIIPPIFPPSGPSGTPKPGPMAPLVPPVPSNKPRKTEGLVGSATRPGGLKADDPNVQRSARIMNQRGGISLSSGGSGYLAFKTDPKTGKKKTVIVQRKAVGSDDAWLGQAARALGLTKQKDLEALRKQQKTSNINRQRYLGAAPGKKTGFEQDLTSTNVRRYMPKGSKLGGQPTGGAIKEDIDVFDIILDYLLSEKYANTIEDAKVIMVNMSEEWKNSILDSLI